MAFDELCRRAALFIMKDRRMHGFIYTFMHKGVVFNPGFVREFFFPV
jgi:hypothetical protein